MKLPFDWKEKALGIVTTIACAPIAMACYTAWGYWGLSVAFVLIVLVKWLNYRILCLSDSVDFFEEKLLEEFRSRRE